MPAGTPLEDPDGSAAAVPVTSQPHSDDAAVDTSGRAVPAAPRAQTGRRFLVMYGILVAAFLFLAWRSETNENAIRDGLYQTCLARQETAEQFNVGREDLIQVVVNAPNAPQDPVEKAQNIQQLRDGLLLPIEECSYPDE